MDDELIPEKSNFSTPTKSTNLTASTAHGSNRNYNLPANEYLSHSYYPHSSKQDIHNQQYYMNNPQNYHYVPSVPQPNYNQEKFYHPNFSENSIRNEPCYYSHQQQQSTSNTAHVSSFHAQQKPPHPRFTPMQKVQYWNQNYHDSGVQSMSQSSAPSIMSSIHAASQISTMSSLPDTTAPELSEQQMIRFQNIPTNFQSGDRENNRRALTELIPLLTDSEEDVVCKALDIVQSIAKSDSDNLYADPLIRDKVIIDGLLYALKTHKTNKLIIRLALGTLFYISSNQGLELIIQMLNEGGTKCLNDLISCISIPEYSCFKYAFLILHNMMTEPRIAKSIIQYVRDTKLLGQIVEWLREKNDKLLAIIVDIIKHVLDRDDEQKLLFLNLNGPHHLVRILETGRYENLLLRATKLLKSISNCDPKKVVDAGALETLHLHLNHSSQRLVRDLLTCIRDLSDVATKDRDLTVLLSKLLPLLRNFYY